MPIVVDPGFAWPPEVDPVVSPDGRLTAIVDPAHAGVLLRADFDDSVPDTPAQPEKVLRRNLFPYSDFETLVPGGYVGLTTARSSDPAGLVSGSFCMAMTTSGTGSSNHTRFEGFALSDLVPGKWVAFALSIAGTTGATYVNPWIDFQNGGTSFGASAQSPQAITATPSRMVRAVQIPSATFDKMRVIVRLLGSASGSAPADGVTYTDAWHVAVGNSEAEARAAVATYFDGDSTPSGTKRYRWKGAPNESVSEEYTPATPFIPGHGATTAKVRFERQDGSVVRSGNPAWAPGGYAHAYDHEATLGGGTLWRAVPIHFDGTEGTPSEYVGVVIPALTDGWAWLKPVADPDKAMLLKVEPPDLSYDGRVDTTSIAGAPRPAATWDVLEGFTTQLRSLVREKNVEEQLMALLDEGPVLAQFPACAGLPDFYFIRGKLDLEHVHWDGWPWRRYQWDAIQIDRPDTTDSPLRIPGLSYDTVARDWTTYDQLRSTVESYNKLLEP